MKANFNTANNRDEFKDLIFYRAFLADGKRDVNSIRSYSYPMLNQGYIIDEGRANLKDESVFYCAGSANVALWETMNETKNNGIRITNNDVFYVGVWRFKPNCVSFIEASCKDIPEFIESTKKYYELTSKFANQTLRKCDLLFYESVKRPNDVNNYCVAMTPNFIDNYLYLDHVFDVHTELGIVDKFGWFKWKTENVGIINCNDIEWKTCKKFVHE